MQEATTPRRRGDTDRLQLTLAIALVAAVVAGGIVFGHGPVEARNLAAPSERVQALPVGARADGSVPDAGQALRAAPADATEPTATF